MMIYDVLNTVISYAGYIVYSIPRAGSAVWAGTLSIYRILDTNYIISYDSYPQYITISYGKSNK